MTPREGFVDRVLRIVRSRIGVFILLLLLLPGAALAWSLSREDEYSATASLLLRTAPIGEAAGPVDRARTAATSQELIELPAVARQASRALPGTSSTEIADAVELDTSDRSDVVNIEATADDQEQAARIANAYARSAIAFRREAEADVIREELRRVENAIDAASGGATAALERQRDALLVASQVAPANAVLVQAATPPGEGLSQNVARDVGLGILAALVLAFAIALLLERLDRRIKTVEELEEIYQLPVLARIPRSRSFGKAGRRGRDEALNKTLGFSEEAEAFRTLRANLRYFNVDRPVKSILVVSPLSGDGKSTIARYLAITMASMGDSVCLVDADLRKVDPNTPPGGDGLSLVLAGFDVDSALTEMPISFDAVSEESRMLYELPNGPLPPNPSELLESGRMRWLIRELENRFDAVIIDSPALVTVSDALSLVPDVSGVLIVSGFDQTTRHSALDLRKQITLLGGRPLGVVANFWTPQRSDYYYYDYGDGKRRRKSETAA